MLPFLTHLASAMYKIQGPQGTRSLYTAAAESSKRAALEVYKNQSPREFFSVIYAGIFTAYNSWREFIAVM